MDGKVCGTASEVRILCSFMEKNVELARAGFEVIRSGKGKVSNAWKDSGLESLLEYLDCVDKGLQDVEQRMPSIKQHMERYANFLET